MLNDLSDELYLTDWQKIWSLQNSSQLEQRKAFQSAVKHVNQCRRWEKMLVAPSQMSKQNVKIVKGKQADRPWKMSKFLKR